MSSSSLPHFIIENKKNLDTLSILENENEDRRSRRELHPSMVLFIGSGKRLKD
jgi:hypothetical protein